MGAVATKQGHSYKVKQDESERLFYETKSSQFATLDHLAAAVTRAASCRQLLVTGERHTLAGLTNRRIQDLPCANDTP